MSAIAPPLTLEAPDGGVAAATIAVTTATPGTLASVHIEVSRNWVDLLIGTVVSTGDISRGKYGTDRVRLLPGSHVLSFIPGVATYYFRFERAGEGLAAVTALYFVDPGDLELDAPYAEDEIASVRQAQSRSVRWFWHFLHAPRALVRYANDSWGFVEWRADDGPFIDGDANITMTPGALRGVDVTLEADRDFFNANHVGALMSLTAAGQIVTKNVTAEDQWSEPILVTGITTGRTFIATVGGTFVADVTLQRSVGTDVDWTDVEILSTGQTQVNDGFDNSTIYYRIGVRPGNYTSGTPELALTFAAGETSGVARITEVSDAQNAFIDVITPFGSLSATRTWEEGAWSTFRGWPACGDLFDGRLWLASIISIFGSESGLFESFKLGENDGDGISRILAVGDASPVRWLKGALRLQLGVDADVADIDAVLIQDPGTLQVRSSSLEEVLTPSNMTARAQSAKICFVDASGYRVRRVSYDLNTDSFVTDDLNRLNEDIGFKGGGFIGLTAQLRPRVRLHLPRADGQLAVMTLSEQEQIEAWARQVYPGAAGAEDDASVLSVTATPGVASGETDQDFVFMALERSIEGVPRRMIVRLERDRATNHADFWHLAEALRYAGPPARVITGLDHLYGEEVLVWGALAGDTEAAQFGPFTVDIVDEDGGVGIDLGENNECSAAIIGREMLTRYMSGKLPYGAQAGTAVGLIKKVTYVTVLFRETALGGFSIGVANGESYDPNIDPFEVTQLYRLEDLAVDIPVDSAPALYTGEIRVPVGSFTENLRDPRILMQFDGAGPGQVQGYTVEMTTQEG